MADPYQQDDDECYTGFLGEEEENKHFFKAFEQVGKTIRDVGFCKPNGTRTKPRETNADEYDASAEADDSTHKAKTVTFDDNVEVEPLIVEDDLVITEEQEADEPVQEVEKEENFEPTAMPLTTFLVTTFVVIVLVSLFCPDFLRSVMGFFDGLKNSSIVKGLFLLIAIMSAAEMFFSSNGQLGGFVEFCWSLCVLLVICTGMYYTYDLEWAKSTADI